MMSYSDDFRECVLHNIACGMKWEEAARIFKVSSGSIGRWLKHQKSRGVVSDVPRQRYTPRKIDPALLSAAIDKHPDATLEELAAQFNCWPQSIHKRCVKLGITRKKNHALRGKKRRKT
jgi:transposase